MERTKLKEARRVKGMQKRKRLTQADVADAIGCSVEIYSLWERGKSDPLEHYRDKLLEYYGVASPEELDLVPATAILTLEDIIKMLEKYDRREVLAKLQQLSIFANVDLVALAEQPRVVPEEFLSQCRVALDICWDSLKSDSFSHVEGLLTVMVPKLAELASREVPYQGTAANLAVQARIVNMIIATSNLEYSARETHCAEAVRFGRLSGDGNILLSTQEWQANTYIHCYHQPQRAIALLQDALKSFNSDISPLNKCAVYSDLSDAYAQDHDEIKARDSLEMARLTMPEHPELDPFYRYIYMGSSELDQFEGMMYLSLSKHFPDKGYARLAYEAFEKSTSRQALDQDYLGGSLIKKADAARSLGDMDELAKCLTKGFFISARLNSLRRLSEVQEVLRRIPKEWRKETPIQKLQEELNHALMVG